MSLLDVVRIATPCTERWSEMVGDDRRRHCGRCDKTVVDLTALTRAEAEALLAERVKAGAGRLDLCARYFERRDGSIVMADCLVRRRRRVATALGVAAALVGTAAVTYRQLEPVEAVELEHVDLEDVVEVDLGGRDTVRMSEAYEDPEAQAQAEVDWRFAQVDGEWIGGVLISDDVAFEGGLFDDVYSALAAGGLSDSEE